jgi:GTP cyclohydrolase II
MYVPHRVIRPQTTWRAQSDLPTRHGLFTMHVFTEEMPGTPTKEHVAMVFGTVDGKSHVPVRVHSECLTSEVFGSLKCDCREQLEAAMAEVAKRGGGAILYLRQEGRGIGLINKVRAYDLQSKGHDTVDANRMLGLPDDSREYSAAKAMLLHLGVESVQLMTNNPEKVRALRELGVTVENRVPVLIKPNKHSQGYLEAKRARMDHVLPTYARAVGSDAE